MLRFGPEDALVLIAACDHDLADDLDRQLRRARYRTERTTSFGACLAALRRLRPDALVLCRCACGGDPAQAVSAIRRVSGVPLLVLLEDNDPDAGAFEEVRVLAVGADDVLDRDRRPALVLEHLRAVLRRSRGPAGDTPMRVGRVEVDAQRVRASVDGAHVPLTLTEFRILEALVAAPGRVMARDDLLERCEPESQALERVVDVHIKNLRGKLAAFGAADVIETVRGVGYRLRWPT